jgi:hypothetical protein
MRGGEVMTMTAQQTAHLLEALGHAFNRETLEQMVRFKLGKDLYALVAHDEPLRTVASELIRVAEQEGWTEALVRAASSARPKDPNIREFVQRYWAQKLVPQEPARQVQVVKHGLDALTVAGRRQDDAFIRITIARFRYGLNSLHEKIDSLRRYATLHDLLHRLGTTIVSALTQAAALHQSKPQRELIELYALQLEREVNRARKVAQGLPTHRVEMDWIDALERCAALVRRGLQSQDDLPLQQGVAILGRLTQEERARISGLLCFTAGELRLGELTQALREIDNHLRRSPTGAGSDLRLLEEIRSSLDSLVVFQARLDGLVNEHFEWQWLDKELAAADILPGATPEERFPRWDAFRQRLLGLCGLSPEEEWSRNLATLLEALQQAGKAGAAAQFERRYATLRLLASNCFFDRSTQILDLSDQIAQIVLPLEELLQLNETSLSQFIKPLHRLLLDSYDEQALAELLLVHMNTRLDEVRASSGSFDTTLFKLLVKASSEGWLLELARKAAAARPQRAEGQALVKEMEAAAQALHTMRTDSDPVQPNTVWEGIIKQDDQDYPTTIYIKERLRNNIKGEIHFIGQMGVGQLSFEGTVTDGRTVSWITDRIRGNVTFPGLYTGKVENNMITGEWRVPRWNQYDRFSVKLKK